MYNVPIRTIGSPKNSCTNIQKETLRRTGCSTVLKQTFALNRIESVDEPPILYCQNGCSTATNERK